MVTFVLDGTSAAQLPRRPLVVTMSVDGASGGAELIARRGGSVDPSVVRHSPGMLIVPRVQHDIVISAEPSGAAATFAQGTVLHVEVGLDSSRDVDPDRAQLTPRDVSGLSAIELATISPEGEDHVMVTTRLMRPELPLGPLATRARAAARSALGVDQLPPDRQLEVVVVVDSSLSMASLFADGSVGAAVELAKGIGAVLSAGAPVRAVLAGQTLTDVDVTGDDSTAAFVSAASVTGMGVGAEMTAPVSGHGDSQLRLFVTDAPVPVATQMTAQLVLSPSRAALGDPEFVGAVAAPPRPGHSAIETMLAEPGSVDEIVRRLLSVLHARTA